MKTKSDWSVEELLQEESFLNYYFKKDETDCWEWEDWAEEHPERLALVQEAFGVLDKLSLKWSEAQIKAKFLQLQESFETPKPQVFLLSWRWTVGVAASLLMMLGVWYFQIRTPKIYDELIAQSALNLIEQQNSSNKPLLVTLSDGSSILLQPNSRLSYPSQFAADRREVYLEGEAFFEVAKNPQKPFLVYANELITKVLGTSFTIKAYPNDIEVKVLVRSGKVSVYRKDDLPKVLTSTALDGAIITPNQEISFNRKEGDFNKTVIETAEVISPMQSLSFEFKDASATDVFEAIEKGYGLTMIYDKELLRHCPVTASLNDEPLYGKLDLVCRAIEAEYQIIDGQIVITSKGCKTQ